MGVEQLSRNLGVHCSYKYVQTATATVSHVAVTWQHRPTSKEPKKKVGVRLPNHQRWYAKWKLSWNIVLYTFFARLAWICMLSWCSLTKFLHRSLVGSCCLLEHYCSQLLCCLLSGLLLVGQEWKQFCVVSPPLLPPSLPNHHPPRNHVLHFAVDSDRREKERMKPCLSKEMSSSFTAGTVQTVQ